MKGGQSVGWVIDEFTSESRKVRLCGFEADKFSQCNGTRQHQKIKQVAQSCVARTTVEAYARDG